MVPHTQGLAARPQSSDVAMELAAMQAAALTQVQHGHLEMMKQLEKREARIREEKLLLNERTRVLAKREHMLARTLCSVMYGTFHGMTILGLVAQIILCFIKRDPSETRL